ncbi:DUF169 domain-containing protein [Desulfotalea psychrophila]|uniref:DUF169 domain-containing protein n=1 Tax=Desulfotalea psychrophila (strain LSv54 / DSM 12343) TaxID=177439 RepID=Q6ANM3_DESPS|nr:DUF169 domain-containing protein [Desulfotalea psychrophila]CAG36051.1 conserved hypothetical protein [Desulfotalea psychrophila LSv54]
MGLSYKEMQDSLMKELRLYHFPVAVKFFYKENEIKRFKEEADFYIPANRMTFCQWQLAARMKGQTVFAEKKDLSCGNAQYSFGWKDLDNKEITGHTKYAKDREQAERFIKSKSVLPKGLLAIAVAPLAAADKLQGLDTVHFYCDNMQAYHLAIDYMAATDTHPLRPQLTMNSSACGGNVYSYNKQQFNTLPSCSGSYNAGKTERGETNVIIPGRQIGAVVDRLLERKAKLGSSAITRPGDGFPGADICKNCPLIIFKKKSPASS